MTETHVSLTVVVVVWDEYVAFLPELAYSLRYQSVPLRLLIVDNASKVPIPSLGLTEETRNIATTVVRLDTRHTLGGARNFGLDRTTTGYISFGDADDVLFPCVFPRLLRILDEDPKLSGVAMRLMRWEDPEMTRHFWPPDGTSKLAPNKRMFLLANAFRHRFPMAGATVFRTEAIRAAGGFSRTLQYPDDWALANALAARGELKLLDEPGRIYRIHSRSLDAAPRSVARAGFRTVRKDLRRDPATRLLGAAMAPFLALYHEWLLHEYAVRSERWSGAN